MNIDFHYGIIYVVARLGGLEPADAQIVAHACQYIDDATTNGVLTFAGGETFERFASAHEMLDYANFNDHQDRLVWAPFHFLPGGAGTTFEERVVCRPDSKIARQMVEDFLQPSTADNRLHHLGVLLHTYVDTWAHQGFSGTISQGNLVSHLVTEHCSRDGWFAKLKGFVLDRVDGVESRVAEFVKVGHGAALHYPDLPWLNWSYTNGFGETVTRDNLKEFLEAATMAYKIVRCFVAGSTDVDRQPDLPGDAKRLIETTLRTSRSEDSLTRLAVIADAFGNGKCFGINEAIPSYIAKGEGSWKHAATGITARDDGAEKPEWTSAFEASDYRKFHDAVKAHRFHVSQFVLPTFGIRLA